MNIRLLCAVNPARVLTVVLSGFLAASPMLAQETGSAEDTVELEEFTVTGSHIPTTETSYDARSTPIDITTRADMEELGFGTAEELLQSKPYVGVSVPRQNNQTGFTPAAMSINLRGLGSSATLTLLNGRRLTPYPRGNSGTEAFVDISSFPTAAIDQVEVLLDGASATYGADAIAGVVNIKTRRKFNGAEMTVRYGNSTAADDAGELIVNAIYGASTEDTNITVGINYYKRNDMGHADREYSAVPPFLSSNSSPLNFQITRAAALEALGEGGEAVLPEGDQFFTSTWDTKTENNGDLPPSEYQYASSRRARFNFNLTAQSLQYLERKGGFASFEKTLFGTDNVSTYGDLFYQRADNVNELAPSATGNFGNPGGVSLVIPARTQTPILQIRQLSDDTLQVVDSGTPIPEGWVPFGTTQSINGNAERASVDKGAYNPFNPFNEDFSGGTRARLFEFGNRVYRTTNQAFNAVWGIKGDRSIGNWNWDLAGYYSQLQAVSRDSLVSISKFNRVANANDPWFDPTSDVYVGTTVPYNPFGYFANPIPSNSVVAPLGLVELKNRRESELYGADFTVTNGELFSLPGGYAGIAIGIDARRETMLQSPDEAGSSGDVIGSSTDNTTNAERDIRAGFVELNLPIFSADNDIPGAHSLNVNLAGRYEDFTTQDDSIFVPKVSVKWQPFDDSFVLRGSWGEGYRQPSMYELYASGLTFSLTAINDPLNDVNEPEQDITTASSPQLRAEESETLTLGFVWTPNFLKTDTSALTFGMDWWDITRSGNVTVDQQDVVDRDFRGETLLPGESVLRDASTNIILVNGVFRNLGNETGTGVDIQLSYFFVTENLGRWDFGFNASYLDSYQIQQFPGAPFFEYKGEMFDISFDNDTGEPSPGAGDDAYLEWRGVGFARWSKGAMNLAIQANYLDGFRDFKSEWDPGAPNDPAGFRQVDSTLTWDATFAYDFFEGNESWIGNTRVQIGIRNIMDQDPPRVESWDNNSTGYPGFIYSPMGRFVFASVTKKL
ncbi:MAG: hypothetical protein DRP71_05950 [Verrucomicrobia bacterium]|nr:MAG: hypothetical protein DRP71_05950 [Verrucomicrobiota bacterium]